MNDNIVIKLLGDMCPADMAFTKGYGVKSQFDIDAGAGYKKNYSELMKDADIAFCNLEAPLINFPEDDETYRFAGSLKYADFLKSIGINIVSLANNHILEQGKEGLNSTVAALKAKEIFHIGQCESDGKISYKYFDIKGRRIGIAAFSAIDLEKIDNDGSFVELNQNNIDYVLNKFSEDKADIRILSFHWGNEYVNIPSPDQVKLAYELIDRGINVIIGHHSHVIQPIEEYHGGVIMYSLGNAMFDSTHSYNTKHGFCVELSFDNNRISVSKQVIKILGTKGVRVDRSNKSNMFIKRIWKDYKVISQSDSYLTDYEKLKKKKRLLERINMKKKLIWRIFFDKLRYKNKLFQNIISYYIR